MTSKRDSMTYQQDEVEEERKTSSAVRSLETYCLDSKLHLLNIMRIQSIRTGRIAYIYRSFPRVRR